MIEYKINIRIMAIEERIFSDLVMACLKSKKITKISGVKVYTMNILHQQIVTNHMKKISRFGFGQKPNHTGIWWKERSFGHLNRMGDDRLTKKGAKDERSGRKRKTT